MNINNNPAYYQQQQYPIHPQQFGSAPDINFEYHTYNQFLNDNLFDDLQQNNFELILDYELDPMRSIQFSKNSPFQPVASRQNSYNAPQQQPYYYQGFSPMPAPQYYGASPSDISGNGASTFQQRAQFGNERPIGHNEGFFDSPLIIQKQVPIVHQPSKLVPQAFQAKSSSLYSGVSLNNNSSTATSHQNTQNPLLVAAAAQLIQKQKRCVSSSASDGEEFTMSKGDEIFDYSDDSCKKYASTNVSSVPSPMLQDKPLQEQQQIMMMPHFETETEENGEEEKSSDSLGGASVSHSQPYFKSAAENDILLAKFWDISSFKLEFDDLNDCVSALLKKAKDDNSANRDIKRRQRKNKDQLGILENEFKKNPDWQRDYIKTISRKLGLRECQVYKWHWDQRKKEGLPVQRYTN